MTTRYPLIVPFWNRPAYLFPLLVSLQRAYIRPQDVFLCEDSGSAEWIKREIQERFPEFHLIEFRPELDPQQEGAEHSRAWAKGQWHCVRSVNRVLALRPEAQAFFYVESDCLVAKSAFLRLAFLFDWYSAEGDWQPLAKIGGYRGHAWKGMRVYAPKRFENRHWVEDINGGCWFGILSAELWTRIMVEGRGADGVYDPRRPECDFADSFFDRNCQKLGARFLRTEGVSIIQHQGMTDATNPQHLPAHDFVGENA